MSGISLFVQRLFPVHFSSTLCVLAQNVQAGDSFLISFEIQVGIKLKHLYNYKYFALKILNNKKS